MNSRNGIKQGDSHRFGKRVSFLISDELIKKPREAKLEFLFLDKKSPLASFSKILGLGFSSQIQSINQDESIVENLTPFIISDEELESNIETLFQLAGKFLATATLFGLNDLHVENILFIKRNEKIEIAPVDVEIIFYHFNSSAETCLLPSPKTDKKACGFASLIPFLTPLRIQLLCDSFLESFEGITKNIPTFIELFDSHLMHSKVRMLFRPTQLYADYLKINNDTIFKSESIALTDEEKIQLEAGDIPYFFSPYNSPQELQYYSDPTNISAIGTLMQHPSTKRHLKQKELIMGQDFILKLKVQSLCHTLFYLTDALSDKEIEISGINFKCSRQKNNLKIELDENQIILNF